MSLHTYQLRASDDGRPRRARLTGPAALTPAERIKMQSWMDEIYGVFKGHVTAIRGGKRAWIERWIDA